MATDATVATILDGLNESADQARAQVAAIVDALGEHVALDLCDQTIHIEASGGMLASDGSRRRTPSGVFFHLVRSRLSPAQRRTIFEDVPEALRRAHRPVPAPPMPPGASTALFVPRADQVTQPPPEKPPTAPHTTAQVQKLVLLQEVLPARNNGNAQRDAEPAHQVTSEETLDRRPRRRARKARRREDLAFNAEAPAEAPLAITRDDRDGAFESTFADRVQTLVDDFVADLLPMLRDSVLEAVRDALERAAHAAPDTSGVTAARSTTKARRRRGKRSAKRARLARRRSRASRHQAQRARGGSSTATTGERGSAELGRARSFVDSKRKGDCAATRASTR